MARDRFPLWLRWVGAFVLLAALVGTGVLIVHAVNESAGGSSAESQANQELVQADQVGAVAEADDEAPHDAALPRVRPLAAAVVVTVTGDLRQRVSERDLSGPVGEVSCSRVGGPPARVAFQCVGTAGGVTYPYDAVITARRTITWCKVDQSPVETPGLSAPVSASCR